MRCLFLAAVAGAALIVASCQGVPSAPLASVPAPPAPESEVPPIGTVSVNASALNIRSEASMTAGVLTQVRRGDRLPLLQTGESWMMVRLPDGRTGWAASRFLDRDGQRASSKAKRRGNCPPDSDFAFATAPMPAFSDSESPGSIVVEAHVDVDGHVQSTKVITNSTGDEALAFLTEREIKAATFIAPVRNCVAREFIFTYTRTF
jgi:uncharacterized protein YgiM (DUF1202 family)